MCKVLPKVIQLMRVTYWKLYTASRLPANRNPSFSIRTNQLINTHTQSGHSSVNNRPVKPGTFSQKRNGEKTHFSEELGCREQESYTYIYFCVYKQFVRTPPAFILKRFNINDLRVITHQHIKTVVTILIIQSVWMCVCLLVFYAKTRVWIWMKFSTHMDLELEKQIGYFSSEKKNFFSIKLTLVSQNTRRKVSFCHHSFAV